LKFNLGIIQDSFKYLKSLKYLDLSSTNLFDLDGCIFTPLVSLNTLKIERVSINCSSCWLPIAKNNSIKLSGQCLNNVTIQRLDSLTDQQPGSSCSKTSIDCSRDYCEPGSFNFEQRSFSSDALPTSSDTSKNRTIEIVLGVIFSIIAILVIITIIVLIYRWKKGKNLLCCDFSSITSSRQHQHHKQIIDNNPTIMESVVTHGANMNIPPYSHNDYAYSSEMTANNKRKLYNPMFTDRPPSEISHQQSKRVSNNSNFYNNDQLYSENL
jgi:hypothetical protein